MDAGTKVCVGNGVVRTVGARFTVRTVVKPIVPHRMRKFEESL